MKAGTTANEVADFFLWLADQTEGEDAVPLTNLHLQKLLYHAQGWCLAQHARPLFDEPVEAWANGPVVYDVWKRFERHGRRPLPPPESPPLLTPADAEIVRGVWVQYRGLSGPALRDKTHQEAPWIEARRGLAPDARSSRLISRESMQSFFSGQAEAAKKRLLLRKEELFELASTNRDQWTRRVG